MLSVWFLLYRFKTVMNKLQIIISVGLISFAAAAQAQEYVRKQVRPDFFIPEKEFNRREKLPTFPAIENGAIKVTDEGVMVKTVEKTEDQEEESDNSQNYNLQQQKPRRPFRLRDLQLKPMEQKEEVVAVIRPVEPRKEYVEIPDNADDGLADDLSDVPEYNAIQQAYEDDIKAMAKTGKMPENKKLETDLQKMSSDTSFAVE